MNFTHEMPSRGYVIYRDSLAGEPFDPAARLQFFPPKDSDDLFFALKLAYPAISTHSERMRSAVIDFLINERDAEQVNSQSPAFPSADVSASQASSAASSYSSWHSGSASLLSSPDILTMPTPNSAPSPAAWTAPLSRKSSCAQSQSSSRGPNTASPPAIDQMTSVFSLSSETQPKTRVRRKMTEAEKADYRQRRIVKACEKCSKRKRKCTHNQSPVDKAASSRKPVQACTASLSSTAAGKHAEQQMSHIPAHSEKQLHLSNIDPAMLSTATDIDSHVMEDFIDLSMASDVDHASFPWSNALDWTLLDAPLQRDSLYHDDHSFYELLTDIPQPTQTLHTLHAHTLQRPAAAVRLDTNYQTPQNDDGQSEHPHGPAGPSEMRLGATGSKQRMPLKRRLPKTLHSIVACSDGLPTGIPSGSQQSLLSTPRGQHGLSQSSGSSAHAGNATLPPHVVALVQDLLQALPRAQTAGTSAPTRIAAYRQHETTISAHLHAPVVEIMI